MEFFAELLSSWFALQIGMAVANRRGGGSEMKSHYLRSKLGRIFLGLFFLVGVGIVSTASAQYYPNNQDPYYRRDRDQDYRRDRDRDRRDDRYRNGGYGNNGGNYSQIAFNQGYQDGIYTGSNDSQRRQNYNPQRSHFYRNGHGDNGGYGRYGNSYQFQQAYRSGFLQGYQQGYQRYGGNNRRRGGNYRWPWSANNPTHHERCR